MAKLHFLVLAASIALLGLFHGPASSAEGCRFRVAAIRAEIAGKPERSHLEFVLAKADRLCRRGEIERATTLLAQIVEELRADG